MGGKGLQGGATNRGGEGQKAGFWGEKTGGFGEGEEVDVDLRRRDSVALHRILAKRFLLEWEERKKGFGGSRALLTLGPKLHII